MLKTKLFLPGRVSLHLFHKTGISIHSFSFTPRYAFLILLCIHFANTIFAQEYDYTHYSIREGLAGNCVYDISQDKDGFIWIATETGVSRFDSRHFTNYTTADGLADNEVLGLLNDSRGRIWFQHFTPQLSYYRNGRIYNKLNDSLLAKLPERPYKELYEDAKKRIWLFNKYEFYIIENNKINIIRSVNGKKFYWHTSYRDRDGNLFVNMDIGFYRLNTQNDSFIRQGPVLSMMNNCFFNYSTRSLDCISIPDIIRFTYDSHKLGPDTMYINTLSGSIEYNYRKKISTGKFLPGQPTSTVFRDKEGMLWIATLNNGIYQLRSKTVKKYLHDPANKASVTTLEISNGEILVGTYNKGIYRIDTSGILRPAKVPEMSFLNSRNNRLALITNIKRVGNKIFCVNPQRLTRMTDRFTEPRHIPETAGSLKDIFLFRGQLLVAGSASCQLIDIKTHKANKTILRMRTTAVYADSNSYFIGTLEGLFIKPLNFAAGDTLKTGSLVITGRITKIISAGINDGLWVATYANGLYLLKNRLVIKHITEKDGLPSNNCRVLWADDNKLWIGTDKGLCRLEQKNERYYFNVFTVADGLCSDIVNSICVWKGRVFAGTAEGLSSFRPEEIVRNSTCNLKFLDLVLGGKETYPVDGDSIYSASYENNRLRISFAGLSFRSAGDIKYHYRLLPGDKEWRVTKENVLEFQSLPTGKLQLEMKATDQFGTTSEIRSLHFYISPPFWKTAWFRILLALACITIFAIILYAVIAFNRKKYMARQALAAQLSELEQMALRAQMNPHFIFNCLNSVQLYILKNDAIGANYYLVRFANLVRQTLENAPRTYISLAEELDYLSNYLALEEMQTEKAFQHELIVDPRLQAEYIFIPNMLIQPFVENAIKHGVSACKNGEGKIHISFNRIDETQFSCSIEDNGRGLQLASAPTPSNNKPKGVAITKERIGILNKMNKEKQPISAVVENKVSSEGHIAGTRVILHFPFITSQNLLHL